MLKPTRYDFSKYFAKQSGTNDYYAILILERDSRVVREDSAMAFFRGISAF